MRCRPCHRYQRKPEFDGRISLAARFGGGLMTIIRETGRSNIHRPRFIPQRPSQAMRPCCSWIIAVVPPATNTGHRRTRGVRMLLIQNGSPQRQHLLLWRICAAANNELKKRGGCTSVADSFHSVRIYSSPDHFQHWALSRRLLACIPRRANVSQLNRGCYIHRKLFRGGGSWE